MTELELAAVEVVATHYAVNNYQAPNTDPQTNDPVFDQIWATHVLALQRLAAAVGEMTHG